MQIFWLIIFALLVYFEISTTQLICIWFAGGAFASFVCALFNLNITVQLCAFIGVSFVLLLSTRKIVRKFKISPNTPTNTDALIGQTAIVTEDISNLNAKGSVKIRGLEWSARSYDGNDILAESYVTVKEIDGVKLIVDKIH